MPISTSIDLKLTNMLMDREEPHRFTIKPKETRTLFTARAKDSGNWNYKFEYYWRYGDYQARHDKSALYLLPVKPGNKVTITQGCHQKFSHYGLRANASDFIMKIGTAIHAARGGLVIKVREDSDSGGKTVSFADKANYIYILHDDQTIGTYLHLKKNGAKVEAGQKVKAGEIIGYSGNTGWSTFPHLHFEVVKPQDKYELRWESLAMTYRTNKGNITCPNDVRLQATQ